jgi:hypothetical protein
VRYHIRFCSGMLYWTTQERRVGGEDERCDSRCDRSKIDP